MSVDFVSATDVLFVRMGPQELAIEIGCTAISIRQARLKVGTKRHRAPPLGWEAIVARMARQKAAELQRLADQLTLEAKQADSIASASAAKRFRTKSSKPIENPHIEADHVSSAKKLLSEGMGILKVARSLKIGTGTVLRISQEMRKHRHRRIRQEHSDD